MPYSINYDAKSIWAFGPNGQAHGPLPLKGDWKEVFMNVTGFDESDVDLINRDFHSDSVAQGHTRDNPKSEIDWGGYDYSYDLPDLPRIKDLEDKIDPKDHCDHKWVITGHSVMTNQPWYNCEYCDMKKEDYEANK